MKTSIINTENKYAIGLKSMALIFVILNIAFSAKTQSGALDLSFPSSVGCNDAVYSTSIQSDGKIIIGGKFGAYDGDLRDRIARVNSDATIDLSFNPGTGANLPIWTTSVRSDGKIIIGGEFFTYNGSSCSRIALLNSNGTFDATFNPGPGNTGASGTVYTTSIENSNSDIYIGGDFTTFNGTSRNRIARLNSNGSLDVSFNPGTGANATIRNTNIQSDGKIIIAGNFTSFNGTGRNRIARLMSYGGIDLTFNPGTGANDIIYTTSIQNDGKIILAGNFTSYNGTTRNRIVRINADGTIDASFNPGSGANNRIYTTSIQSDGKIIIGGSFTSINGTSRNGIARLNADGSLDLSFNPGTGTGVTSTVYTNSIQSDNRIIIGGGFFSYNGTNRGGLARLHNNIITTTPFGPASYCSGQSLSVSYSVTGTYNAGNIFTAQLSNSAGSFASPTTIGTLASTTSGTITTTLPFNAGSGFRIRIVSSDPVAVSTDNGSNLTLSLTPTVNDPANQTICVNTTTNPVAFSGNLGSTTYNWNNDNNTTGLASSGSGNISSFTGLNAGSTPNISNITVTPTLGTCVGTPQQFSITINSQIPTVVDPPNQSICVNNSTAAVTFSGNNSSTIYSWTNNNIGTGLGSSGSGNIASFIGLNAGTSTIVVTPTLESCVGSAQVFTITVIPIPTVNDPTDQNICRNTATSLVTFSGNNASTTFNWNNDNTTTGLPASGSGNIMSFSALNTGSIPNTSNVTVTPDLNGCIGSSQTFIITVSPIPTAINNGDGTITTSFGDYYEWINCATSDIIPAETSQTFSATVNGSYAAIVTLNGCTDTSDCIVIDNIVGLHENKVDAIQVYPNPTKDFVTILMSEATANIEILDIQGKVLESVSILNGEIINFSNYEPGVYFFRIISIKNTTLHRIIKK